MTNCSKLARLTTLIIAIACTEIVVASDFFVTGSSMPKFKVGQKIPSDAIVSIPAGEKIIVLVKPENETLTFKGQYNGTLQEYEKIYGMDTKSLLEQLLDNRGNLADCSSTEGAVRKKCKYNN